MKFETEEVLICFSRKNTNKSLYIPKNMRVVIDNIKYITTKGCFFWKYQDEALVPAYRILEVME